MSKTVTKTLPADFHHSASAKAVRRLRRVLPLCERLGTAIGADSAISALECYEGSGVSWDTPYWGAALRSATPLLTEAALATVDDAHGRALCDVADGAFLSGYYAGLAAARVGGAK